MKRLPDSELEIMIAIWELNKEVTRTEIEEKLDRDKKLSPTTIDRKSTRLNSSH